MDIANFVLTFGPAGLVAWSLGKRLFFAGRTTPRAPRAPRMAAPRRDRPALPVHLMLRAQVVRGGSEPVRAGGSTYRTTPVRPQQNQLEPLEPGGIEPPRAALTLHMSREEEIAVLAVQRNADGSYRHSANKITELMGGTAADVKKQIAEIRGTPAELPQAPKPDPRFPQRTPEQEALRQQLMKQKAVTR